MQLQQQQLTSLSVVTKFCMRGAWSWRALANGLSIVLADCPSDDDRRTADKSNKARSVSSKDLRS